MGQCLAKACVKTPWAETVGRSAGGGKGPRTGRTARRGTFEELLDPEQHLPTRMCDSSAQPPGPSSAHTTQRHQNQRGALWRLRRRLLLLLVTWPAQHKHSKEDPPNGQWCKRCQGRRLQAVQHHLGTNMMRAHTGGWQWPSGSGLPSGPSGPDLQAHIAGMHATLAGTKQGRVAILICTLMSSSTLARDTQQTHSMTHTHTQQGQGVPSKPGACASGLLATTMYSKMSSSTWGPTTPPHTM